MDSSCIWIYPDRHPGDGQYSMFQQAPVDISLTDPFSQLIERRLPPSNAQGGLFNLKAFRNKAYTFYCISGMAVFLGLYTGMIMVIITVAPDVLDWSRQS